MTDTFIYRTLEGIFSEIGGGILFWREIFRTIWVYPVDRKAVLFQIYNVTMNALVTTASSGFFVGAIMTVQFYSQLKSFDSLTVLGGLSTSGTVRALGP